MPFLLSQPRTLDYAAIAVVNYHPNNLPLSIFFEFNFDPFREQKEIGFRGRKQPIVGLTRNLED